MELTALIHACIQNDRVAQRTLYSRYKDNLYTIAVRILNDKDAAGDILQETFIDAFKQLGNLRQPAFFHSWIKKILVRKTYDFLSKKKDKINIDEVVISDTRQSDISYIEQAISSLPYKSRTVFVMVEVEGFSHKEIAEALNISVGTSKSQLNYAKTKLKKILAPYRT